MANPNPSPSTRFGAIEGNGNPSRAKQKGARVIETVRGQDPIAYMRIAAALLPTNVEISESALDALPTNSSTLRAACAGLSVELNHGVGALWQEVAVIDFPAGGNPLAFPLAPLPPMRASLK